MIDSKKMPPATEGNPRNIRAHFTKKPMGKLDRMLILFSEGYCLNTFQAKELSDTCLHTTISDLQIRHGIKFAREWQTVFGRYGAARVRRYWLDGDNLIRANEIVSRKGKR